MKSFNLAVIGVTVIMLFISSFSVLSVNLVSAQDEGEIIVRGKATAKSVNQSGDAPDNMYAEGDYPPIIAAQRIDLGAVVAGGIAATCRDTRWREGELEVFLDIAFQWMVPGAENVLWYEGYNAYNTIETPTGTPPQVQCQALEDALENMGYNLVADATEPITSSLLAPYDILVIPQLQLGTAGTGGDPTLLPSSDVNAIKSFVEGGGGLLIMEQSDYGSNHYSKVHNKILRTLDFGWRFQDDQLSDETNNQGGSDYMPIADVYSTTDIGASYQTSTGTTEIGLYSVCSLALPTVVTGYEVSISAIAETYAEEIWPGEPLRRGGGRIGAPGDTLVFPINVVNEGVSDDTYTITVEDELGWSSPPPVSSVSLASGENKMFELDVTVPEGLTERTCDQILVRATGASGAEDNVLLWATAYVPVEEPPYPVVELAPGEIYYWFSATTMRVEPPAVPIMSAVETGFGAELTPREPWPCLYLPGEYPPIAAVALVGDGRVAAVGGCGSLRSSPANYIESGTVASKKLMPRIVRWLVDWGDPRERKFLFYHFPGAFNDLSNLLVWLDWVDNEIGFELDVLQGGETITPELLNGYDVLQMADVEEKYPETHRAFNDSELQAIADWVGNGGGILLMEQADFSAWADVNLTNPILEAIRVPIRFNDDELYDVVNWTMDGPWFPQIYVLDPREENSEFNVWFGPGASAEILPASNFGDDEPLDYTLTITNEGPETATYTIEVSTDLGWEVTSSQSGVTIESGGSAEVTVTVTVPDMVPGEAPKIERLTATVTNTESPWISASASFTTIGRGVEKEGLPWTTIAAVISVIIVIIIVIAVVKYVVPKKRV